MKITSQLNKDNPQLSRYVIEMTHEEVAALTSIVTFALVNGSHEKLLLFTMAATQLANADLRNTVFNDMPHIEPFHKELFLSLHQHREELQKQMS